LIFDDFCDTLSENMRVEGFGLTANYNKLWKLLIDKKMNKRDLQHAAGVSTTVIAKLTKGRSVTTDVLLKICRALDCDFADIMEVDRSEINAEGTEDMRNG
jgi:DNA-binding Xre family transcriptional regulator